jgi:hypothetical protein
MNGSPEALLESPQVLIAEEEKIIVEEVQGTRTVVEERYIVFFRDHTNDIIYRRLEKMNRNQTDRGAIHAN